MNISILSLSANNESIGRASVHTMRSALENKGHVISNIDIRELPPIWVSPNSMESLPSEYEYVNSILDKSEGVILVVPVYCYTAGSPAKAVTEIFRNALEHMPVGIMVAAGSIRSHLAVGDLMISMMFEQGTVCFPKTVMANSDDLVDGSPGDELATRINDFAIDFVSFCKCIKPYRLEKQNTN